MGNGLHPINQQRISFHRICRSIGELPNPWSDRDAPTVLEEADLILRTGAEKVEPGESLWDVVERSLLLIHYVGNDPYIGFDCVHDAPIPQCSTRSDERSPSSIELTSTCWL